MKTKFFAPILPLLLCIFWSCKEKNSTYPKLDNDNGNRQLNLLLGYYNFMSQPTDGTIKISSYSTLYAQNLESRDFKADGVFVAQSTNYSNVKINQALLGFNDGIFSNRDNKVLKNIYGQNAEFSFKDSQNNLVEQDLYIPSILNLSVKYNPATYEVPLSLGTDISWNADIQNGKGIVIILDYNPRTNYPNITQNEPNPITKVIGVADTGSYILKEEDLTGFPNGASVTLSIGRAGFVVKSISNSNKSYGFYGCSLVDAGATISK